MKGKATKKNFPSKPGSKLITYSDGESRKMQKGGKDMSNKMPKTIGGNSKK